MGQSSSVLFKEVAALQRCPLIEVSLRMCMCHVCASHSTSLRDTLIFTCTSALIQKHTSMLCVQFLLIVHYTSLATLCM